MCNSWHEERRCEAVGKLLNPISTNFDGIFNVLGWHRVPSENVKELVGKIKVPASGNFSPGNEHGIKLGQSACGARNTLIRIHHEHKRAKLVLHHLSEPSRGDAPQSKLFGESLPRVRSLLEA